MFEIAQTPFFWTIYNKVFSEMEKLREKLREEILTALKEAFLIEEFPPSGIEQAKPQANPQAVRFNPGLENEYIVTFSERGFLIDDTRLSFEEIENALSKEYSITLKSGTIIDPVKMQQILKYKDKY